MIVERGTTRLAGPFWWSAALHAAAGVLLLAAAEKNPRRALPPVYKVDIVAAPAGPRRIGTVGAQPPAAETPAAPAPAPSEPAARTAPIPKATPKTEPARATPSEATAQPSPPAPAGGGPIGGKGTDVATVRTEGIDFPYPGYLNNIVRQIALNFNPRNPNAPLRAEVMFLIRRDGSVSSFRFVTRSGVYAFDLEAQGAVEAAASARAFGPLPEGFRDDVLPVFFSFDPRLIR